MNSTPTPEPDPGSNRLRRLLMPNCHEMSRLTSRSLDTPPHWNQRAGMLLHLALCATCRRYRRQLLWLRRVAGMSSNPPAEVPVNPLSPEARERLVRRLRAEAGGPGQPGGKAQ